MKTAQEIGTLFDSGLNCSQITLMEFCGKYGMDNKTALQIACGFGGGMRCGEVCGAVTGGIMSIGLKHGMESAEDKEAKNLCYAKTSEFCAKFKEKNNTTICRELLGCDISTPDGRKYASEQKLFSTKCTQYVKDVIEILKEMQL